MNSVGLGCQFRHPRFRYLEAKSVHEACSLLSEHKDRTIKFIAGGTDLMVAMRRGKVTPKYVLNIKTIPNLDYIHHDDESLRIGALCTLDVIESSLLIKEKFPLIAYSAHQIGTQQIRNLGTIGGNCCNASPSADMAPSLIGFGAKVKIKGLAGDRIVNLSDFFEGPGETVLQADEMLTEIQVPNPVPHTRGVYQKLQGRTKIDLAVVGVAVVARFGRKADILEDPRIVLGAVASTPIMVQEAETIIGGKSLDDDLIRKAAKIASEEAKPISDVRASANYRKQMIEVMTYQAVKFLVTSAQGRPNHNA